MREDITKHYRDVLPKINGWKWEVEYFDTHPNIGNVSIYLREVGKGRGKVHAYLQVSENDSFIMARAMVSQIAGLLTRWVKEFHVGSIGGYTTQAFLKGSDSFEVFVEGRDSNEYIKRKTIHLDAPNPRGEIEKLLRDLSGSKVVPSNLTGGK